MAAKRKVGARKSGTKNSARSKAPARRQAGKRTSVGQRASGRGPSKRTAARKTLTPESLARKIVRATTGDTGNVKLEDLYAEDCTSIEATGGSPAVGLAGLQEKLNGWMSVVDSQAWKARHVWVKGHTIAIEWEADLKFRDGRRIQFEEVAVHEVRGGKIVAERYYYDPAVLAPPSQQAQRGTPSQEKPSPVPAEIPRHEPPVGTPPLDPVDL